MEDRESMLAALFGMDEDQREKEQERLIARKRKRKGIPRKLVLCNEKLSTSESFHRSPTEYFSNEECFDLNKIGGDFVPCSLIVCSWEDIISKITSFVESCSCNCYIASAAGCVARASILECGTASTHEGSYEIVSLTGHVSMPLNLGRSNGYGILITLASKNDSVFGGYVSGPLIAKTNVQIVLWRFTSPSAREASTSGAESPAAKMEVS
ncbi:hypothetical protein E1A91_A05G426400v1 [Gossypium mustelinum]|uniref:AT-hook motif nuclear-localized protein n=1 Tax=Gossypium mustelinum TaxID=34275 RepID=A0A5D2ZJB8_GOSMU|nr:hypothetical protein E1A91_A05G426400v1 [Gossypium mustelinum]TYJ38182.1 hypothetical protein E1A91_A05G426400v1 [Gossypium mustelinum]TYJ38183.1 hypothetical protein E1A91_A05G426400v1 [Gossypium mustelinum]